MPAPMHQLTHTFAAMPCSYDIDVTRTTYFNGTKPKVRAVATVTAGKMSHADVAVSAQRGE